MKQILIFSGTTEGRMLAERLAQVKQPCMVCVATEYGREVMEERDLITLHTGRLSAQEMQSMMKEGAFWAVVDATHPFAAEVSKNIKESAQKAALPYLRLKRETISAQEKGEENRFFVKTQQEAVELLSKIEGNILLTTGSKELPLYCKEQSLRERLFVRVLPGEESIRICREQGLTGKQMIAMQGPFSKEFNKAVLKQFSIRCLVTKESGETGGYPEKLAAAAEMKIPVIVIENPENAAGTEGMSCKEVETALEELLQKRLFFPKIELVLAGIGMGGEATFTIEEKDAVKRADYLFGAERLLASVPKEWNENALRQPYYLAEDIFPCLTEQLQRAKKEHMTAVLLFSGDIGFYSGAKKVQEAFLAWQKEREQEGVQALLRLCPGISSISYLSAKSGISYQDADILSIHGSRENHAIEKAARMAGEHKKIFLLTSGLADVKALGRELIRRGLSHIRMTIGFQLSYQEEQIVTIGAADCEKLEREGLYTCILENPKWQEQLLTHGLSDDTFCRGKVPMTKEEVREISLCKLRLKENAVFYDIGSGTGSIAVEAARLSASVKVYAIERKAEAAALIKENCRAFHLENVEVIEQEAKEALEKLPVPTHAFIGGSGGNLREILALLYRKNKNLRVVMNAVTLETTAEAAAFLKEFPVQQEEVVQVAVSRAKRAGSYHLMQAENPVFIFSFQFRGEEA